MPKILKRVGDNQKQFIMAFDVGFKKIDPADPSNPNGISDVTFDLVTNEIRIDALEGGIIVTHNISFQNTFLLIRVNDLVPDDPDNLRKNLIVETVVEPNNDFLRFEIRKLGTTNLSMKIIRSKNTDWSWVLAPGFIGVEDTKVQRDIAVGTGIFNLEESSNASVILHANNDDGIPKIIVFYG